MNLRSRGSICAQDQPQICNDGATVIFFIWIHWQSCKDVTSHSKPAELRATALTCLHKSPAATTTGTWHSSICSQMFPGLYHTREIFVGVQVWGNLTELSSRGAIILQGHWVPDNQPYHCILYIQAVLLDLGYVFMSTFTSAAVKLQSLQNPQTTRRVCSHCIWYAR